MIAELCIIYNIAVRIVDGFWGKLTVAILMCPHNKYLGLGVQNEVNSTVLKIAS